MTFGEPMLLALLAVPVLFLMWVWRRQGRRVSMPFDHAPGRESRILRGLLTSGESLPALTLTVAILLWAGPQKLDAPKTKRALTNIQVALDISGSMTAQFGAGNRYDGAMKALNQFLDYREGDAFGLTFFGNSVMHWVPLTNDVSAFKCSAPFMSPTNRIPGFGGTEIGKALLACRDVLTSREEGDRMIILISDGMSADLYGGREQEIARKLRADNIVVYGVHIANSSVPGEIVTITSITGGEVFNPGDPDALETVFKKIDEMQATKMELGTAEFVDDFWPYCLAGLIVLGLITLFQLGLRYTPW